MECLEFKNLAASPGLSHSIARCPDSFLTASPHRPRTYHGRDVFTKHPRALCHLSSTVQKQRIPIDTDISKLYVYFDIRSVPTSPSPSSSSSPRPATAFYNIQEINNAGPRPARMYMYSNPYPDPPTGAIIYSVVAL